MVQSRKTLSVMAKYMHMFFPENKAVSIDVCDLVAGIVEGTFDNGESTFSFKATRAQILELLECMDKTKVLTPEDKKKQDLDTDVLKPVPAETTKAAASPAPSSTGIKITFASQTPAATTPAKPQPPMGFTPPTSVMKSDRQRMSKPGEQELMSEFEASWPNKYLGRKKLEPHEEREKHARDKAMEIARSYILSGDRTTVKQWVSYNKAMLG